MRGQLKPSDSGDSSLQPRTENRSPCRLSLRFSFIDEADAPARHDGRCAASLVVRRLGVVSRTILCADPPETAEPTSIAKIIHRFPVHEVNPNYPKKPRKKNAQGTINLLVTIATDGSVQDVSAESGDRSLAPAAMEAFRQWRYGPEMHDGVTVESQDTVTLE